jgi:hypothetical protein
VKTLDWSSPALRVMSRSTIIICSAINVRKGALNEGA